MSANAQDMNNRLQDLGFNIPDTSVPVAPQNTQQAQQQQVPQQTRSIVDRMFGEDLSALTDLGAGSGFITGAAVGGSIAGPPGAIIGGTLGTVVGTGIGEDIRQLITGEYDFGMVLDKMAIAGYWEMLGPVAGKLYKGGRAALDSIRAGIKPSAEDMAMLRELDNFLRPLGAALTPGQLTGGGLYQGLENFAAAGFFTGKNFKELYKRQSDFLVNYFETEIAKMGKFLPEGGKVTKLNGEIFQEGINQGVRDLRAWAGPRYAEVDKLATGVSVDLSSVVNSAKAQIQRGLRSSAVDKNGNPIGKSTLGQSESVFKFLASRNTDNTFAGVFDTIQYLNRELRRAKSPGAGAAVDDEHVKYLSESIDQLHKVLDDAAETSGNKALIDLYNNTSTVYREGMASLADDAIAAAVKVDPEYAGEAIAKMGNVTAVEKAFEAADEIQKIRTMRLDQIRGLDDSAQLEALRRMAKDTKLEGWETMEPNQLFEALESVNSDGLKNAIKIGFADTIFMPLMKGKYVEKDTAQQALSTLANLQTDDKMRRTFQALFSPEEQAKFMQGLKWADRMEQAAAGNYSLMVRGQQSRGARDIIQNLGGFALFQADQMLASATGFIALTSPPFLARLATNGKLTEKLLKEMEKPLKKFSNGTLTLFDASAVFTLLASNALETDKVHPAFHSMVDPETNARQFYEEQAADMRLQAIGFQLEGI